MTNSDSGATIELEGSSIQPLVHILVPVYNGENFLGSCLESVLAQTYSNWRCHVADNASTDRSAAIAAEYTSRDPRFTSCSHADYLSILENWNRSLTEEHFSGRYFKILCADDELFPECLERMVRVGEEHPSTGIVGAYGIRGTELWCHEFPYPGEVYSGRDVVRSFLLSESFMFGSPTNLLMRTTALDRSRPLFDTTYEHGADTELGVRVLKDWDYGLVHQVLTYTRMHDKTMTSTVQARLNSPIFDHLRMLDEHGQDFFDPGDLESALRQHLRRYKRFLLGQYLPGQSQFRAKRSQVLAFHRKELKSIGRPIGRFALMRHALWELRGLVTRPQDVFGEISRRLR